MSTRSRRLIGAAMLCAVLGTGWLPNALAQAPPSRASEQATVDVTVTRLRSTRGKIWLCLWKEGATEGFPSCDKGKPLASRSAPANAPRVAFTGLLPGAYAVTMFHDEKGTGAPEMNLLGMPTSGIGLSNNPVILGPPTFAKSRFAVPATTRITIETKYLF